MNFLWTVLFMAIVGVLIGAFTNHIAILMLFRPHEAKYIGSWRLPFTPGLIPKRRAELATQLGRTVNDYLLTPETFKEKLLTQETRQVVSDTIEQQAVHHIFQSEKTLAEWLRLVEGEKFIPIVEQEVTAYASKQLYQFKDYLYGGTIEQVVPAKWLMQFDEKVENVPNWILQRGETFVRSDEGAHLFRKLLNNFLESKGTFGNMLQMMVGDSNTVVEKFQKEALKFLSAAETEQLLRGIIAKEWDMLKQKPVQELLQNIDWSQIEKDMNAFILRKMDIQERLNHPLSHYWPTGSAWFTEEVLTKLVDALFKIGEEKLEIGLRALKIDEMVEKQVNDFPIETLEGLVIQIATRELKMITVLGGVLGGVIGIVQGLIVFFTT